MERTGIIDDVLKKNTRKGLEKIIHHQSKIIYNLEKIIKKLKKELEFYKRNKNV